MCAAVTALLSVPQEEAREGRESSLGVSAHNGLLSSWERRRRTRERQDLAGGAGWEHTDEERLKGRPVATRKPAHVLPSPLSPP